MAIMIFQSRYPPRSTCAHTKQTQEIKNENRKNHFLCGRTCFLIEDRLHDRASLIKALKARSTYSTSERSFYRRRSSTVSSIGIDRFVERAG